MSSWDDKKMDREEYMRQALLLAQQALENDETPVGCIIAGPDGRVLGRGRNRVREKKSALAHAEMEAIAQAGAALGDGRLTGCTLYVTLEPCPMCAGAMIMSRISTLVYGAREPLSGSCGSILNLFEERYPSHPAIYGGVLAEESVALLQSFFGKLRGKSP